MTPTGCTIDTRQEETDAETSGSVGPEVALELLSDDHARTILQAISDTPRPARELIEVCEGSKPTVYRRLKRLEEAGLVDSSIVLRADGHHRKEFSTDFERVTLDFADGDLVTEVDPT